MSRSLLGTDRLGDVAMARLVVHPRDQISTNTIARCARCGATEMSPKRSSAARQLEDEIGHAEWLVAPALCAAWDQTVLNATLDAVLLDFKAADAGEIDWLVIGVAARAEGVEVLGARPPLEDIDPGGIHRICRDREVETPGCLAGEAHSTGTCDDMRVSVRRIEDEVTGDDEHPPIVPTSRWRPRGPSLDAGEQQATMASRCFPWVSA